MSVQPEGTSQPADPSRRRPVAMIGLGHMGTPMAHRLLRAGYPLSVYNRSPAKAAPFDATPAKVADTPASAVAGAAIVITSLFDDASELEICQQPRGLLSEMDQGALHVSTTTMSPECADRLDAMHREAGQRFVAAPVVGRPPAATAGVLTALVAGSADARADATQAMRAFATRTIEAGDRPGAACTMKLTVNFLMGAMIEIFAEVFAFAEKGGVRPQAARELIEGMLGHASTTNYLERVSERRFSDPGFETTTGLKDMHLILAHAAGLQMPLPVAGIVRDRLLTAMANGQAGHDWSVFSEVARHQGGLA